MFHFRRRLTEEDRELLAEHREWLRAKTRAFEARKAAKATPSVDKRSEAAPAASASEAGDQASRTPLAEPADPWQAMLAQIRADIHVEAADRLVRFLAQARALGLKEHHYKSLSHSYRVAILQTDQPGAKARWAEASVFYLLREKGEPLLVFPVYFWYHALGAKAQAYVDRLIALGCIERRKPAETKLVLYLKQHNSDEMFSDLHGIVQDLTRALTACLDATEEPGRREGSGKGQEGAARLG